MTSPSRQSSSREPHGPGLLDVLYQLPSDDLRRSIWLQLSPVVTSADDPPAKTLGRSFRLACQRARGLTDQLTRRLALCQPVGEDREAVHACQAAFLGRQEGLEKLDLDGGQFDAHRNGGLFLPAEPFVQTTLVQGRTACRRVHTLRITVPPGQACSGAVGQTIPLCCPSLRELDVFGCSPTPAFCVALHGCPSLHQVTIAPAHREAISSQLLAALAPLGALRSLDLMGVLEAACVPALAAFTRLTKLRAESVHDGAEAADLGRTLGTLTQLTALSVPLLGHSNEALSRVVAQLGGLTHLVNLTFGQHCGADLEVDLVAFDALVRLSGLTSLSCPAFSLELPAVGGGHLLRLQTLYLEPCGPVRLAATLRPLLPLPALRELHCIVYCMEGADIAADEHDEAPGAAAAAAWQAAMALAKAPCLRELHLDVSGDIDGVDELPDDGGLSASQALASGILSALLTPLGNVLTHLCLDCHAEGTLDTTWPLLCQASRLQSLELSDCHVPEGWLLEAVGSHLGALRFLSLRGCTGVTGASAVTLAGVRSQPLSVDWHLELEQRQLFRAAARPGVCLEGLDK